MIEEKREYGRSDPGQRLAGELQRVCRTVGHDLGELRALMDNAVRDLTTVFAAIADTARTQLRASQLADGGGERCERLAREIEREAQRAVLYLQFHDMASQMMENLRRRAEAVELGATHMAGGDLVAAMAAFQKTALIEARKPHELQATDGGDVDLF